MHIRYQCWSAAQSEGSTAKMKKLILLVTNVVFAAIVSIFGNIIASYLQEKYHLLVTYRILLVGVIFLLSLTSTIFLTIKLQSSDNYEKGIIRLRQVVKKMGSTGKITGVKLDDTKLSNDIVVNQKVKEVNGNLTGVEIRKSQDSDLPNMKN
jgi:hypothetical protein